MSQTELFASPRGIRYEGREQAMARVGRGIWDGRRLHGITIEIGGAYYAIRREELDRLRAAGHRPVVFGNLTKH